MTGRVVVVAPAPVTVVREPTLVAVAAAGVQGRTGDKGDKGDPGSAGGSYYVHTQTAPAASWVIDHNLNRRLHVTVFDTANGVVYADVEHGSLDQTTITFASPVAGSAVLS